MVISNPRGKVLRMQYLDLRSRIDLADGPARSAFFRHIQSTFEPVLEGYAQASSADRKRILEEAREVARRLWARRDWPQALALGIIILNVESRFVPGEDASYVQAETANLIREGNISISGPDQSTRS